MRIDGRRISLRYSNRTGEPTTALAEMDFTITAGETIGVLGPSGSGKSSLLYLLSGLKRPTAGTVFFDEEDIARKSSEELEKFRRANFGFIFQRHYLIHYLSVLNNILLPLNDTSTGTVRKAMGLLERLGLSDLAGRMPNELSVGQRQLVAVARALINDPRALFADEPTAALDTDTALTVMEAIATHAKTAAVIVVTHDVRILRHADHIVKLRDGKRV